MTAPPVAPTNLEIPREVVASWEREADASKPHRECGCDSWRDYVVFFQYEFRRRHRNTHGYRLILTFGTPCLAIPCVCYTDEPVMSCTACWFQPWSPYGPIVCCYCWEDTYPAWLER